MLKQCRICKVEKELCLDNFHLDKSSKDGFNKDCKVCRNKHISNWSKARPKRSTSEAYALKQQAPGQRYRTYIKNAQARNLEFSISKRSFYDLTEQCCFYCRMFSTTSYSIKRQKPFTGLDRVDNNKGYTIDNVVPCCNVCNKMKEKMNLQEFITQCRLITLRFHEKDNLLKANFRKDTAVDVTKVDVANINNK